MAKRPYADGELIRDPSGRPIVLVGAKKHRSIVYYADPNAWQDEQDAVYDLLRGCGANVVYLALNRWLWDNTTTYKPAIDNIVSKCKARGIYVVLAWQEWFEPYPAEIDHFTWEDKARIIVEYNDWQHFIMEIAQRYKDEPTVIGIEPLNEVPSHEEWWQAGAGISLEEGRRIWIENQLKIIDAIHSIDPTYIVLAYDINYLWLKDFTPYSRPNIVYGVHHYYGWDVGYNDYANTYFNATTEEDFQLAYEQMVQFYKTIMLNFRDTYNVPVANTETSIAKIDYHTGAPLKNNFRQFSDQMRMMAEFEVHDLYFSADRDYGNGNYWGLFKTDVASQWSDAGLLWSSHVREYFPTPTPPIDLATAGGVGLVIADAFLLAYYLYTRFVG